MDPREANAYWSREFPECPPIGFLLKHVYQDRWIRLYTLPNGATHAEQPEDFEVLCERQNVVLKDLFRAEDRIMLITSSYSDSEEPVRDQTILNDLDPDYQFLHSIGVHELALEFDTPTYWHIFVSGCRFEPGRLDKLMRAAAQPSMLSGVFNVILAGPQTHRLAYLCSGGLDVIMETPQARAEIRTRYDDWVSHGTAGA